MSIEKQGDAMDRAGADSGQELVREEAEGVAILLLNRPERRNALNDSVLARLSAELERLADRDDVQAVVVAGVGNKAFSAGDDIRDFPKLGDLEKQAHLGRGQRLLMNIADHPLPIIAAIEGYCLGGGLELAIACDLRIASESAVFGLPEVFSLGAVPAWGAPYRLTRLVGEGRAREMLLFGRRIDAATALSWGLLSQVTPAGQALETAVQLARRLPVGHRAAVGSAKKMLKVAEAADREVAAAFDLATFMHLEMMNRHR